MLWFDVTSSRRPSTRVEVVDRRNLRLIVGDVVALTVRIDDDYYGYSWERAAAVPAVIPPFAAADARRHDAERWTHSMARTVRSSPATPLYPAKWVLGPWTEVYPAHAGAARALLEAAARDDEHGYTEWDIGDVLPPLLLRSPPPLSDGRVKAWRKLVREGRLPPLLLWWVSGLDRFVVLDGAARLVAALAEDFEPPALALAAARVEAVAPDPNLRAAVDDLAAQPAPSIDMVNRLALRAYGGERVVSFVTRAWPASAGR